METARLRGDGMERVRLLRAELRRREEEAGTPNPSG